MLDIDDDDGEELSKEYMPVEDETTATLFDAEAELVDDPKVVVHNPQPEARRNALASLPLYTSTRDVHGKTSWIFSSS